MKTILNFLCYTIAIFLLFSCEQKPKEVLIFSKTAGFRHSSIEPGTKAIKAMLAEHGLNAFSTEDASHFTDATLKGYSVVIFLNTTGDILDNAQQASFERYIQAGGGFVGIHAATDTEYDWPWYNKLVGAYFESHPQIQEAELQIIQPDDPICAHVPADWSISEEWYNFRAMNKEVEVLMKVDESSYEGGKNGDDHPAVWKHEFDGGRAFYTAMGHKEETFENPIYMQHLWEGIKYVMAAGALDYSKATTMSVPEETRFSKEILDFNIDEPMEIDELGDRGIVYIERRGAVRLYDYQTKEVRSLDTVDVFYANEDGLLGIAVDPNYHDNHWVYLFYSPNIEDAVQYVSRFTLEGDDLEDEKIMLTIPLIRKCCHSGGSLEFDKDGLLYVGIGDNTNPFESQGFAPIDERAGRALFDAQRSAGNANDLRGKILRIKPEPDGTYSIPEGNLFPEGTTGTRPEIYVMGLRNPFRYSIDSKTGYVYWGDVGPDAGNADSLRGPAGMGEFNQAREPGFYGWPYTRGNNQVYFDYDFVRKQSKAPFDPKQIINDSPNNTGIRKLPPVQESMIWYSYESIDQFPWVGDGGVNPMGGPVYHTNDFPNNENRLPSYFDGKWFVYEWMRDWIYVVHLDENQNYVQADPFMPGTEFSHPMDMLFTKDGSFYILEYGQKWNSRNLDARLSRIVYNSGNRPPVAAFEVDREVGGAPLKVAFDAGASKDYDGDDLKYTWSFGDFSTTTTTPTWEYEFTKAGVYDVVLTVKDGKGEEAKTNRKILVGNEQPKIEIVLDNNDVMYYQGRKVKYTVNVSDQEDGSTIAGSLDPSKVKVTLNYIPEGEDMILASIGHQQNSDPEGMKIMNDSDCKACHALEEEVAGPSFKAIAERYEKGDKQAIISRIIKGSQGLWGETMMSPHPQLEVDEVGKIVDYILSLDNEGLDEGDAIPLNGEIAFTKHLGDENPGKYILMASYLDRGNAEVAGSQLSALEQVVFVAPKVELEDAEDMAEGLDTWRPADARVVSAIKDGAFIKTKELLFDGLAKIKLRGYFNANYNYVGEVEIRKGSADGQLLGSKTINHFNRDRGEFDVYNIDLKESTGRDHMVLVFRNSKDKDRFVMNADWVGLEYSSR